MHMFFRAYTVCFTCVAADFCSVWGETVFLIRSSVVFDLLFSSSQKAILACVSQPACVGVGMRTTSEILRPLIYSTAV